MKHLNWSCCDAPSRRKQRPPALVLPQRGTATSPPLHRSPCSSQLGEVTHPCSSPRTTSGDLPECRSGKIQSFYTIDMHRALVDLCVVAEWSCDGGPSLTTLANLCTLAYFATYRCVSTNCRRSGMGQRLHRRQRQSQARSRPPLPQTGQPFCRPRRTASLRTGQFSMCEKRHRERKQCLKNGRHVHAGPGRQRRGREGLPLRLLVLRKYTTQFSGRGRRRGEEQVSSEVRGQDNISTRLLTEGQCAAQTGGGSRSKRTKSLRFPWGQRNVPLR